MTIQDALERAKQLKKTREGSAPPRIERPQVSLDETGSLAVVRERAVPEPAAEHHPELRRIEFDVETCRRHRVQLTDEQLSDGSGAAAAYRLLRSRVLHRIRGGNWSCVGVTSAGPGDGKTLTAVNLAISIAREKQRAVYLIDLDMRNPSVFETVGAQPLQPLSTFFSEDLTAENVLFATPVENLIIAGNADPVPNASELLASSRLEALLAHIRRRSPGALVVIDLPPALSTDEALVVAPRTDAMFLVVAEGKTRRDGLARALNLLSDFNVAGVILNRSSEVVGSGYYHY